MFLDESVRIAHQLVRASLRHGGMATWLASGVAPGSTGWRRTVRTLDGDVAGGTAGVGWFLARVGSTVQDAALQQVAVEAVRHALHRSSAGTGPVGWYTGSLGVAWAAVDVGRVLVNGELVDAGRRLASQTVASFPGLSASSGARGLVGGSADALMGVIAVADVLDDASLLRAAGELATAIGVPRRRPPSGRGDPVGLARGGTGTALAAAAWSVHTDDPVLAETARAMIRDERQWYEPGIGWLAPPAHEWIESDLGPPASWCSGAAGIGAARIASWSMFDELSHLGDLTAAVEIVRQDLAALDGSDASVCHGVSGGIDLLISASHALGEPAHISAARVSGVALMQRAGRIGSYNPAVGPDGQDASLLYGLAGTAMTMLRLSDGGATPTITIPPFVVNRPTPADR